MLQTRFLLTIDRPPPEVFDYVADPANNARWQGPTESAHWTSDRPPRVGSTVHSVVKVLGRTLEFDYAVIVWDPPNTLAFESLEGSIPFAALWRFEPKGEAGTEVTLDVETSIGGFFKVAERLIGPVIERQLDEDLNTLKRVLERR